MHDLHGPYGNTAGRRLGAVLAAAALAAAAWATTPGWGEAATFNLKCATATINDVQHELCKRYAQELGINLKLEKTLDRQESLQGADFVINTALASLPGADFGIDTPLVAGHDRLRAGWEVARDGLEVRL